MQHFQGGTFNANEGGGYYGDPTDPTGISPEPPPITSGSNPSGFTPMYIGDWHPPVGGGTDTTAPSGGGTTSSSGTPDQPTMTDQQMIDTLGYDPGDPRNDLTKGFGSGVPTQRIIGNIANFLGNAAFPGLGALTGAAAAKITQMIQNGAGKAAVANAIKQFQSAGGGGDTTPPVAPSGGGGTPLGSGFNFGDAFSGLPSGFTEGNRFGGGAPTFTYQGSQGPQWSAGGSIFGGTGNLGMSLPGSFNNIGAGGGGSMAPGMANLYLHGAPMQSWAQNQGYNNVGDWLRQTGFTLAGGNPSGAGVSGAERPMTSSR